MSENSIGSRNLDYEPLSSPEINPWEINLSDIDMSNGRLFQEEAHHEYFKRLRKEAPIHYCSTNPHTGPYWSVTRYDDIMKVDTNHKDFSSEPSVALYDNFLSNSVIPAFIATDPPLHGIQRKVVSPAVGGVRLANVEDLIRTRTREVLDGIPIGTPFNWVENVSIELTTRMLATLFDFPFDQRHKLTFWSDVGTSHPKELGLTSKERDQHLFECLKTFTMLFKARQVEGNKSQDFISLMANNEATREFEGLELLGNIMLLIIGGNDTTRNSMSGGVWFLHENPEEFAKVKDNHDLIPGMVSEIIRYQTPISYMRRTATRDLVLGDKQIAKGDKVVMWYASANRDEEAFDKPDQFIIDRKNSNRHMAFGFGIHRCMGNRVAEAQLRILWEEILQRFDRLEVVGKPTRLKQSFVNGISSLDVVAHEKTS